MGSLSNPPFEVVPSWGLSAISRQAHPSAPAVTARNLIQAAKAWPDARFGLDISVAMLETARAKVAPEGLPLWWRALLFAWLATFDVTPRATLRAALADVAGTRLSTDFHPFYGGYAWRARLDRR